MPPPHQHQHPRHPIAGQLAALAAAAAVIGAGVALAAAVLFTSHPAALAAAAASALALAWLAQARGAALAALARPHLPPRAAAAWVQLGVRPEVAAAVGFACVAALAGLKLGVLAGYALALRLAARVWPAGAAAVRAVVSRDPGGLLYVHPW